MAKDIYSEILHDKVDYIKALPSVTPIFQVSGFDAGSENFYARKSTPNGSELEMIFSKMESSKFSITVSTGMTAIFMCLNLLKPDSSVLISCKIYGCTYKLFQQYCNRHRIKLDILDLSDANTYKLITETYYDMCFFETPTNPFLNTITICGISAACKNKNKNCIIIVDNTWATPIYQKPLQHGADISLYSGTKYFGGHSDVMCGILTTDNEVLYKQLIDLRFYGGLSLPPYSSWLVRRSLQTFKLRIERQSETTKKILKELKNAPFIKKIYYPNVDGKQLTGYGGIIFVEVLDSLLPYYDQILKKLTLFGTGTGMACVTSMIAQPYTGSHAALTDLEKSQMGIKRNLLRLCFGLKSCEDLLEDLLYAFKNYNANN